MNNQRTESLQNLIQYSTQAELILPRIILDGETFDNRWNIIKHSLENLENDADLTVTKTICTNQPELTAVNISFKPANEEIITDDVDGEE